MYATSGVSRMAVNAGTAWNHCAGYYHQSRRIRSPCSAHITEDDARRTHAPFLDQVLPSQAPFGSRVARSASLFRSAGPGLDRAPLQSLPLRLRSRMGRLYCSSSLQQFLGTCCLTDSFHLSSCRANMVEQSLVQHCQLRKLLALSRFVGRQMSTFPDLLLSTWPETCSSSSSSHLLCCLIFLWAGGRSGRNWRFGCATMAAKFASMMLSRISKRGEHSMSSSFAVRWLLDSRVTRILKNWLDKSPLTPRFALSGLPMEVKRYCASTLTTHKPANSIVSASTANAMSSTRCTVCLPWKLAYTGLFQFSILLQACSAPSHRWQLHLGSKTPDPSREQISSFHVTPNTEAFRLAVFKGCPGCKHQATHPEKNCGSVLFLCIRSQLLCHTENDASGICHTLRAMVSSASIPSAMHLGQRPSWRQSYMFSRATGHRLPPDAAFHNSYLPMQLFS